jgi:hypothetical protein
MLYAPTITDQTLAIAPLMAAGMSLLAPSMDIAYNITLPLMAASVSVVAPSVALSSALTLPLMDVDFAILDPTVNSAFASLPSTTTGTSISKVRSPNPYSPVEMRRANQKSTSSLGSQAASIATINLTLSELQSNVDELESDFDSLVASTDNIYTAEADETITTGKFLYLKNTGHVALAQANAASTMVVCGIASEAATSGFSAKYNTDGKLSKSDWTAVCGAAALTPGAYYYLSAATAGMITTVAPSVVGQYVVRVGRAMTTLILDVEIETSVLL